MEMTGAQCPIKFVLGGARSGKTQRADSLALESGQPVVYVAACPTGIDTEMDARIARHRELRPESFATIENRHDLAQIAREHGGSCLILDCLTLWLYTMTDRGLSEADILALLEDELRESRAHASWVIVSSEIGLGVVPIHRETRAFRDLSGRAQQVVARLANRVEFMVAGIPMLVKSCD
jgi:adenosylcobinamide kinase/adenosylcobinamide-phosphate guanylyltransferase